MLQVLKRLVREEEGQGMAEYGLILALIAIVVIGAITGMGEKLVDIFDEISGKLNVPTEGS
ncbi:MAG: Flp family type IVb pilin [Syntrophomonadaceae bacterium]|jgi:pilus assembly protein Flp/PilA|nr:Flp family type IVb pilin [Syntrophomonadaceae bacterium]